MNISSSAKNEINTQIQMQNKKKKVVNIENKDDMGKKSKSNVTVSLNDVTQGEVNKFIKGKTSKVLDNLNKQKVTTENLKEAVDKLKDNKDKDEVKNDGKKDDKEKIDKKSKKVIDKMDLNKDGKKSSQETKVDKEKMTLNLVKDLISELKKDKDEVHPQKFKNIVKMINDDLLGGKNAEKINKFLDN